ncbi:hypothetical protein CsatB_010517 [Cannabis sativa]
MVALLGVLSFVMGPVQIIKLFIGLLFLFFMVNTVAFTLDENFSCFSILIPSKYKFVMWLDLVTYLHYYVATRTNFHGY